MTYFLSISYSQRKMVAKFFCETYTFKILQQQLMLKFTALLSDQFRQSSSYSSLSDYHVSKRRSNSEWGHTHNPSTLSYQENSKQSSYLTLSRDQKTIKRGESYSGIKEFSNSNHFRRNSNLESIPVELKYLRQDKNHFSTDNRNKQSSSMSGLRSWAGQETEKKYRYDLNHSYNHFTQNIDPIVEKRLGNIQVNPIRQTPKQQHGRAKGSRLNNLQQIQKKIQATLNIRKKLNI